MSDDRKAKNRKWAEANYGKTRKVAEENRGRIKLWTAAKRERIAEMQRKWWQHNQKGE